MLFNILINLNSLRTDDELDWLKIHPRSNRLYEILWYIKAYYFNKGCMSFDPKYKSILGYYHGFSTLMGCFELRKCSILCGNKGLYSGISVELWIPKIKIFGDISKKDFEPLVYFNWNNLKLVKTQSQLTLECNILNT